MTPIPVVLIGAGQRGARSYASYALRRPDELRIVAVAEPNEVRRKQVAADHQIPPKRCFSTWEALLDAPLLGDIALIAHSQALHSITAFHALQSGYHVLLTPPMATHPEACVSLVHQAQESKRHLIVGHSLRYTAFYRALHDLLVSGRLGQMVSYKQERSIPFWHVAHQFVRGNQDNANPMLWSEGLHEFDLLLWMVNEPIKTITSVGANRHFDLAHAPIANVPLRCVDECPLETECPFSAVGTYIEKRFAGLPQKGWPHSAIADGDESHEVLQHAIQHSHWGDCVYHQERQLVDYQTFLMKGHSGVSISLTINGHSLQDSRFIQINGTHGNLVADFSGLESRITFFNHATQKENTMNFRLGPYGHGGDHGLMGHLYKLLRQEGNTLTSAQTSAEAHLLAMAAEEARQEEKLVKFSLPRLV